MHENNLRGGTQFFPLSALLPSVKGKIIWLSFAKTHTKDCGFGPNFYRPALVIMVEENDIYHLDLIASEIDFGIEPMVYEITTTKLRGKNVFFFDTKFNSFLVCRIPRYFGTILWGLFDGSCKWDWFNNQMGGDEGCIGLYFKYV